ncbi:MAG: M28 family metallopeptidase [Dehalococcoidia bacterium]|nr:M28 family metallopeptidase [Dehalococcoidia bacterium]
MTADLERFDFPRVEYRTARLTWPDGHIDGVPMYDGGFTQYGGIQGELCEDTDPDLFGKIVVATSATRGDRRWTAPNARAHYEALAEQGVIGVVAPSGTTGADDGPQVALRNAEHILTPFALPVLQVAARDARALASSLVLGGVEGTLEVDGERLKSRATNVVASVPGAEPDAGPVVVMTPKSGWFTCAAERGGGIATWLALADAVARARPRRTVHFVATSGHELHHRGLEAHLDARRPLPRQAVAWLHLGASLGARYPQPRAGASDQALHALATSALGQHECETVAPVEFLDVGSPGSGEARNIAERGGRYVTFLGGHRYFHSPQDTVDMAVDAENVARWASAALDVLRGMIALPDPPPPPEADRPTERVR